QIIPLWATTSWLYAIYPARVLQIGQRADWGASVRLALAALYLLLILFATWALLSAMMALNPKVSLKLLGSELLPYTAAALVIPRLATQLPARPWRFAVQATWWTMLIAILGIPMVLLVYSLGGRGEQWLEEKQFFRLD